MKTLWLCCLMAAARVLPAGEPRAPDPTPSNGEQEVPASDAWHCEAARLARMKEGREWHFRIEEQKALTGYLRCKLGYAAAKSQMSWEQQADRSTETIHSEVLFALEPGLALRSFRVTRDRLRGPPLSFGASIVAGQVKGSDQDGDAYRLPFAPDLVPGCALLFWAASRDWAEPGAWRIRRFYEEVQDCGPREAFALSPKPLQTEILGQRLETRTLGQGQELFWLSGPGQLVQARLGGWTLIAVSAQEYQEALPAIRERQAGTRTGFERLEKSLEDPPVSGLLIVGVAPGSPAEKAGLCPGDILTAYAGQPTPTREILQGLIERTRRAGLAEVELILQRGERIKLLRLPAGRLGIHSEEVRRGVPFFASQSTSCRQAAHELERSAYERCGSRITWYSQLERAREAARAQQRPILWWVTTAEGSPTYNIGRWNDYLRCGVFTDPQCVSFINRRCVPLRAHLDRAMRERLGLGPLTAPALVVLKPDGQPHSHLQGLTSLPLELFHQRFRRIAAEFPATPTPSPPPPQEASPPPGAVSSGEPEARLRRAEWLLEGLEAEAALEEVRAARSREGGPGPHQARAGWLEGRALRLLRRGKDALAALDQAAQQAPDPKLAEAIRTEAAWLWLRENQPARAWEVLGARPGAEGPGTGLPPRSGEGGFLAGVVLRLLNRDEEARAVWQAMAEADVRAGPGDPWAWRAAAEVQRIGPVARGFETFRWVPGEALAQTGSGTVWPAGEDQLEEAVQEAILYLLGQQTERGGWEDTYYDFGGADSLPNVRCAVTALCAEALLCHPAARAAQAGLSVEKAFGYLGDPAHLAPADEDEILWARLYPLNFYLRYLPHCTGARRQETGQRIEGLVRILEQTQRPSDGLWRHEYPNGFVSGSVLLALAQARAAGFAVRAEVIERAAAALEKARLPRGSYAYTPGQDGPAAWKGGIGRAVNAEGALRSWGRGAPALLTRALQQYFRFNFVQERRRKDTFHNDAYGTGGFFFWYNAHVVSQTLRHADRPVAREAARQLLAVVAQTRELDGTWVDSYELGKTYATAMALLTLAEARRQLAEPGSPGAE